MLPVKNSFMTIKISLANLVFGLIIQKSLLSLSKGKWKVSKIRGKMQEHEQLF